MLHAFGSFDREVDVGVGAFVQLPVVAALEQLAEAGDLAQRLLEVVGGDVSELLQLQVGAAQFFGLAFQQLRLFLEGAPRGADFVEFVHDALPHGVHVAGDPFDLGGCLHFDAVRVVAVRDLLQVAAELVERAEHPVLQHHPQEAAQHDDDHDHEGQQSGELLGGGVQVFFGLRPVRR